MAIFTLTIDSQTEAFGGGRRSGERQQIAAVLMACVEAVRNPGEFEGPVLDINRDAAGAPILEIGSWSYTPAAPEGSE